MKLHLNKANCFKVGDTFHDMDTYILARTVNWKDSSMFHLQLISVNSGNRYSNSVITLLSGIDELTTITKSNLAYLLEYDEVFDKERIEAFIATHQKGIAWFD